MQYTVYSGLVVSHCAVDSQIIRTKKLPTTFKIIYIMDHAQVASVGCEHMLDDSFATALKWAANPQ